MQPSSPTDPASSIARLVLDPMSLKKVCRSGLSDAHTGPFEKPSKVVLPMAAHSSPTLPGTTGKLGTPASGGRRWRTPSRRTSGEIRENMLK